LYDLNIKENDFSGELGYYITDGLAVAGTCKYGKADVDFAGTSNDKVVKTTIYGAYFKYVVMFNGQMGINLEGSYKHQTEKTTYTSKSPEKEKNNIYIATGDFYITPKIGIEGEIEFNRGDNKYDAGNTYKGSFKIFFIPNFAVSAGYGVFKPEDSSVGSKEKLYMAALTARI